MKQKPEVRMPDDAASDEGKWVRRSLSRARVQLGQAVAEVLTTGASGKPGDAAYDRMRELLQRDRATLASPAPKPATQSPTSKSPPPPPRRSASSAAGTGQYQPAAPVQAAQTGSVAPYQQPARPAQPQYAAPVVQPRTGQTGQYQPYQTVAAMPPTAAAVPVTISKPPAPVAQPQYAAPAPKPAAAAASAASSEEGADPIRTLTMARLLAVQGYRKRALSIYDELLARDPHDPALRAEADRLRS
ncbi:MAG: hypothetical protein RL701_6968 [Pseudomonadota bacterium]|jgi:hypothetical protein